MTSVKDVLNHATQTLTAAVEVVSDVVQNLESQTKEVIQAVVDVAVAVSEALVAGTWNEFFAKLQEAFEAMNRVRALRANMGNLDELMLNLSKKQDKERVEEIKERIDLAMTETAAMKKLLLDEARRRQQLQVGPVSSFDDLPKPPPPRF